MKIIGILGGVASGKSFVAGQLAQMGAGVLDADRAAHAVLRLPAVEEAARGRWGETVFGADGHMDRSRLAKIVFSPPPKGAEERSFLEELTHPEIGRVLEQEAQRLAAAGVAAAVLDAPLVLESGWDRFCDRLVFVDVPRKLRIARALARGWTQEEFAAREGAQESLDCKRARADVVVDNSGSPEETQHQLERFWRSLVG
jgi:dephospho-CoA kinase